MWIENTNTVTLSDSDTPLAETFIKIFRYQVDDNKASVLDLTVQFGVYLDYTKWEADWRGNVLRVQGIDKQTFSFSYNRETDVDDVEMFCYVKLRDYLLAIFPTWEIQQLVIHPLDVTPH